jgi:hypothetical protein
MYILKTCSAIICFINFYSDGVVNVYSAGVLTHDRRIGSWHRVKEVTLKLFQSTVT